MNTKAHIPMISAVLKKKGVEHVVIAPGSRNAPLIQTFFTAMPKACISIVDERSAAYFAMGVAVKSQKPVVVITTSGTAVLNLGPAVAEAYYQGVSLIVITADRPAEWLDQQDNQTIRQRDIFTGNCKAGFELPVISQTDEDLWYTNRIVNQAYNLSVSGKKGPVHINVPLREPLYELLPEPEDIRLIDYKTSINYQLDEELSNRWNSSEKILIICGQHAPDKEMQTAINLLSLDSRVTVMSESISNIKGDHIIENPDSIFSAYPEEVKSLAPDLVIYYGGQIVSKQLKNYLRSLKHPKYWYITPENVQVDTFKNLSEIIHASEITFFKSLSDISLISKNRNYSSEWKKLNKKTRSKKDTLTKNIVYSDLWVLKELTGKLVKKDILFAGNSSIIRYLQTFDIKIGQVYSNRGTSGIDGCISTAAGIASVSSETVITIVGDLSFIYDSNGLWNKNLPKNLKIIVVNNKGGGIFSMIEGPSKQTGFTDFFKDYHPVSIKNIACAFGVQHYLCTESESLNETYISFYNTNGAAILEIETPADINTAVYHNFMEKLKKNE